MLSVLLTNLGSKTKAILTSRVEEFLNFSVLSTFVNRLPHFIYYLGKAVHLRIDRI